MIIGETVVQIDAAALVTAATTIGGGIGTGIVVAMKMLIRTIERMHRDNRQVIDQQWELLSRLAQNTRVAAESIRQVKRKVVDDCEGEQA